MQGAAGVLILNLVSFSYSEVRTIAFGILFYRLMAEKESKDEIEKLLEELEELREELNELEGQLDECKVDGDYDSDDSYRANRKVAAPILQTQIAQKKRRRGGIKRQLANAGIETSPMTSSEDELELMGEPELDWEEPEGSPPDN